MSVKKKGFVTLDTIGLFDDSDIEEEISSFLQDSESRQKVLQKSPVKEFKSDQKGGQVMKDEKKSISNVKSTKENVTQVKNSDQKKVPVLNDQKGGQVTKGEKKSISDAKSTKENVHQVKNSDQKNVPVANDEKGGQVTKDEKKSISDAKSTKENVNQVKKSDQKNVPVVNSRKGNQEVKSNKTGVLDPKLRKGNQVAQVNKKTSDVIGAKRNEQKKEIETENVLCNRSKTENVLSNKSKTENVLSNKSKTENVLSNKSKNTPIVSESSSSIIVIDDLEFFIADKDEEGKSIERDSCYSPISSADSELFDSTALEQEIQSFLGKEFLSEAIKQSGKVKNKSSVSTTVKAGGLSKISNEKGENDMDKVAEIKNTMSLKTRQSKNNHSELEEEKYEELNDLPKSQKEKTASNNQTEISFSSRLQSKDIVKEREFSDKNIKDDTTSGGNTANQILNIQVSEENVDSSIKTVGNDNEATRKMQDLKREKQHQNLPNKEKTEVKSTLIQAQDSKKETKQLDLSSKGKTELKCAAPGIKDSKKETQQLDLSSKGKIEVKSMSPVVRDSKKQIQDLPSKGKIEDKSATTGEQDSKKEMLQLDFSSKGKTEINSAPELGIIIGDYEKDDKKCVGKELISEGNKADVTSEETKQVNKRKTEESSENERDSKKSKKEQLTSSDYEKKLELKITDIKDKLSRSSDFIINKYSKESMISRGILRRNGLICDLDGMKKCSSNEWMATVCTFIIGIESQSDELTVGFKMEDSENKKTSNVIVKSISEVVHNYPDHVIGAAKVFEKMIQAHARGKGGGPHLHDVKKIWKELCIYTNKKQDLMFIMRVSADSTSIIKEIYNLYVDFFKNGEGKKFRVTSIYITCYYKMRGRTECWIEHLTGSQSIEIFRGLYVNYAGIKEPWTNIYGLRMLCRAVEELLMPTRSTTVLEIFCSTGLLGHYLSKLAGEVLAYDDPEVIRSMTKHATRNNITGIQYFSGDPQSELLYRIEMARYSTVSAVISCNPYFNRHISISAVMKILREVKKLDRLVMVATANTLLHIPFRTLCAPYSMERGEPFFPVKAIPIDTMPLQDGYAVVILFRRQFESSKHENSTHVSRPKVKEEWWNWIKDDELKDRWKEDEEKKGRKTDDERKDDDRRRKRTDEEEKKLRFEEQATRMIRGELEKKRQDEFGKTRKEEGGDRRGRRKGDDDDDREYIHGMWQRKKYKGRDGKSRKVTDEEEEERKRQLEEERKQQLEEERKRQLEEEMKRKIQEQLDIRRLQELERIRKEEEEQLKREEEERKKKEMEEKAKRLTFFRKRLKEEQRRRAQGDQKVEVEKEQIEEETLAKNKEIEEDQKKQAQIKSKKKQLEKEEKKPLEQLRRQIEEEKVKMKRAAERKRQAQIEEKKRKIAEEERRQKLGNQRIPVWEQPPLELGILEQRKVEDMNWRILEEERYRRSLEEEAYRKVEKETVVFDYNHGSNRPSIVAKQEEAKASAVESNTMAPPSNAVSRPVMKWLEKLREVSGDASAKEKPAVENTSNKWQTTSTSNKPENLPTGAWPLQEKPVAQPPSLLSLHVEKPASLLLPSSDKNVPGLSSSDTNASVLLSAPIRPLLQPPGFFNVSGRDDLPGVGRSNVGTRQSSLSLEPSRPLIEPFVEQQGLSSIAFGGHDNFSNSRYNYGGNAQENTAAGLRGMVSHGAPSVNNLYGFAGGGRYDSQTGNSGNNSILGDVHLGDSFSFKQTLQEMRTYGSSYTGQGQY